MKLYLARFTHIEGDHNHVLVFPTARERAQYVQREEDLGNEYEVEKHTGEFPATNEGIVDFFNHHAWHY